jgi:hypothetical protein
LNKGNQYYGAGAGIEVAEKAPDPEIAIQSIGLTFSVERFEEAFKEELIKEGVDVVKVILVGREAAYPLAKYADVPRSRVEGDIENEWIENTTLVVAYKENEYETVSSKACDLARRLFGHNYSMLYTHVYDVGKVLRGLDAIKKNQKTWSIRLIREDDGTLLVYSGKDEVFESYVSCVLKYWNDSELADKIVGMIQSERGYLGQTIEIIKSRSEEIGVLTKEFEEYLASFKEDKETGRKLRRFIDRV